MNKILWIICIMVITLPVTLYGSETDTGKATGKTSKPAFVKPDIKKEAPRLEPNIPEEYKPLIEVYDKYWKFIKEDDLESAYKLETEDYKKVVSLREYKGLQKRSKLPLTIKAVRALEVKKKDEKEVIVKGSMWLKSAMIDTLKMFHDRWVMSDKEWRHVREIEDIDAGKDEKPDNNLPEK